ncbi:variable surface protein [Plasmodium gonderi]|uniref:Variable surface protein n=1 Tax=Plasmodium gonderi TaxID=77519 RepID=A0A1Y1JW06_PLAGO|nr:variable surface protein [Plasmodium gonderi]GAW84064.1 variable surface protein [Plasmodium gonderi]
MNSRKYNFYILARSFDNQNDLINTDMTDSDGTLQNYCMKYVDKQDKLKIKSDLFLPCMKVMTYLGKKKYISTERDDSDVSCVYIFYLINKELQNSRTNDELKQFYKDILLEYKRLKNNDICKDYEQYIPEIDLNKIKDMNDMNNYIDRIKNNNERLSQICNLAQKCSEIYMRNKVTCEHNYDPDFCKALKNIMEEYNDLMKDRNCENNTLSLLPSIQMYKEKSPILIPSIFMLIIAFFLFFLFKFTPYGPYFRRTIKRNIFKSTNLGKDFNEYLSSEAHSTISGIRRYNILYNCV